MTPILKHPFSGMFLFWMAIIGRRWVEIPNLGTGTESSLGFCNLDLWRLIRRGSFDAVLCYAGYLKASLWIAFLASRLSGPVFLSGTYANSLSPRSNLARLHILLLHEFGITCGNHAPRKILRLCQAASLCQQSPIVLVFQNADQHMTQVGFPLR
jgi:hypothetical protein